MQYFIIFYATLSRLSTWKLSPKFYLFLIVLIVYKLLINYQRNSNIEGIIKNNMHFDNTFKVNKQKR